MPKEVELQPHQKRVIERLKENNSVLAFHGLGSGKTLTALSAGKELGGSTSIIGPAALKDNFHKEKKKHKVSGNISYSTYAKPEPRATDDLLVYDEAHRMGRLESQRSQYPDHFKHPYTLLLTGTPIRNSPDELIPLLRGLDIPIARDRKKFNEAFVEDVKVKPNILARVFKGVKPGSYKRGKNLEILEEHLRGKVDYHEPKSGKKSGFPERVEEILKVQMTPEQLDAYRMALKQEPTLAYKIRKGIPPNKSESSRLNAFLNATRQISNTPAGYNLKATEADEPKLNLVVDQIKKHHKKDPNYKGVTYSNYLDAGVGRIAKRLDKTDIPYALFTGQTTDADRAKIVKEYNKGKIKHLLISGAGSEGLDLKGTKLMQVTEPHWNSSRIEQAIGRAIRMGSHKHLPEPEQKVKVQKFIATLPEPGRVQKFLGKKRDISTDEYLYMLAEQKDQLNKDFLKMLQEASSGK